MINKIINVNEGRMTILGRDLYEMLEVKTKYSDWFKRMCEYGFEEGKDYYCFSNLGSENNSTRGGQNKVDHQITIDMAKEICMIQRTPKGKMVRRYFIEIEKDWNSPEKTIARALKYAVHELDEARQKNHELIGKLKVQEPLVEYAKGVQASKDSILIGEMAKILRQNGINTGEKRLFQYLRENGYLMKSGTWYNQPTQRSMDLGIMEIQKRIIPLDDNKTKVMNTTKITAKGQVYFLNHFLKKNIAIAQTV